jgi:hypothetical protein
MSKRGNLTGLNDPSGAEAAMVVIVMLIILVLSAVLIP